MQAPLCARCEGIYSGFLIGYIIQWFLRPRSKVLPPFTVMIAAAIPVIIMIVDALGVRAGIWDTGNRLRLLFGMLCGSSISILVYPGSNYAFWKTPVLDPAIHNLKQYAGFVLVLLVLFSLSSIPSGFVFLSLAYLSIGGIFILYGIILLALVMFFGGKRVTGDTHGHKTEKL
jgi:uncharacterized membrane protein